LVRPALLCPQAISARLEQAHLEAVLAHEVWHVRRRDNLTAAFHMLVEAIFWFHPLLWWLEKRLVVEREYACDEEISLRCGQPQVYAESILRVCEFCLQSPLTCASGITGADLKRRNRSTMVPRLAELTLPRRIMVAAFACLAISAPVAFGIVRMIPKYGQILHAGGPLPSFEVASVRPWQAPSAPVVPVPQDGVPVPPQTTKVSPLGEGGQTSDRVHFIAQAALLVAAAYGVPLGSEGRRIVAGPDWMGRQSDRYEVRAKIGDSQFEVMKKMTPEQQREQVALMEQALLAERFRLKVHFEMREMPVYSLVVTKGGAKLTPAREGEVSRPSAAGKGRGREISGQAVKLEPPGALAVYDD